MRVIDVEARAIRETVLRGGVSTMGAKEVRSAGRARPCRASAFEVPIDSGPTLLRVGVDDDARRTIWSASGPPRCRTQSRSEDLRDGHRPRGMAVPTCWMERPPRTSVSSRFTRCG